MLSCQQRCQLSRTSPCTHCTGLTSDVLVSEDQFSEGGEKFADLSLMKRKQQQQQRQDVKNFKEHTEEQSSIVVNGSGVCCFAITFALFLLKLGDAIVYQLCEIFCPF